MKTYEKYVPSGVEWIGDIPDGWKAKKLKYVSCVNRITLSENTSPNYEFRYVDIGSVNLQDGIKEYTEMVFEDAPSRARRIVEKGDTIVSTVRTYLKAIAKIEDDKDVIVSTGFAVVKPQRLNSDFFSYVLRAPYFVETITANSVGVSYPAINASDIMQISIVYPDDLDVQQEIADYLNHETTRIDSIVKAKETLVEHLKEKRIALITHAVTKGIDSNAKMKPSGIDWIGDIPDGWRVTKIKYECEIKGRIGFKGYNVTDLVSESDDGALALGGTNITSEGKLDTTLKTFISQEKYEESPEIMLFGGEIVMTKVGAGLGQVALIPNGLGKATINPNVMLIRKPRLLKEFLLYYLQATFNQQNFWLEGNKSGAQPAINQSFLANQYLLTPNINEQKEIVSYLSKEIEKVDLSISNTINIIEKLKEYRMAIISACVTGKLDVRSV